MRQIPKPLSRWGGHGIPLTSSSDMLKNFKNMELRAQGGVDCLLSHPPWPCFVCNREPVDAMWRPIDGTDPFNTEHRICDQCFRVGPLPFAVQQAAHRNLILTQQAPEQPRRTCSSSRRSSSRRSRSRRSSRRSSSWTLPSRMSSQPTATQGRVGRPLCVGVRPLAAKRHRFKHSDVGSVAR